MRLISVVIGAQNSQTRFNECSKLFNYGFANFENRDVVSFENPVVNIEVNKGKQDNIDVFAKEGYQVVAKKGEKTKYDVDYALPEKINAPTKAGDVVGRAIISKDGSIIREIDLIIKMDIESLSVKDYFDKIVFSW